MSETFQAEAGFQDFFHKAIKMALRCILSVNSHLLGFKLSPSPTHGSTLLLEKKKPFHLLVTR